MSWMDVGYTLSQDVGGGREAKRESDLQEAGIAVTPQQQSTQQPSSQYMNPAVGAQQTPGEIPNPQGGALADYQMQLMLLEQQNKRRLLMAKQEQAPLFDKFLAKEDQAKISNMEATNAAQTGSLLGANRQIQSNSYNHPVETKGNNNTVQKRTGTSAFPNSNNDEERPSRKAQTEPTTLPEEKNLAAETPQTESLKEFDVSQSPRVPQKFDAKKPKTVYRIKCTSDGGHNGKYYSDRPTRTVNQKGVVNNEHWKANQPLDNLKDLATDGKHFILVRDVDCGIAMEKRLLPANEQIDSILILASELQYALKKVAKYHYNRRQRRENESRRSMKASGSHSEYHRANEPRHDGPNFELLLNAEVENPDVFFFHHEYLFETFTQRDPSCKPLINGLLSFLRKHYCSSWAEAKALFQRGIVSRNHLERLFEPNELLLVRRIGHLAAFVLRAPPVSTNYGSLELDCWCWLPTGSKLERFRQFFQTVSLSEEKMRIEDLGICPLAFANPQVFETLKMRGQKFWALLNENSESHVNYKGWNTQRDEYLNNVRFIIDYATYKKVHPVAKAFDFDASPVCMYDYRPSSLPMTADPDINALILLPPDIHGFNLMSKEWMHLSIENILRIKWNTDAFERLVLRDRVKELVKALVSVRASNSRKVRDLGAAGERDDIVAGKGKGLIMLLHGGPGTGKTLTAESVAESAGLPLYRVTCSDVGTRPEVIEKYLNNVLYLGKKWNCVLLLDEADVFLEERSLSDLKRNSLVAVFLRIVEYYDGILILTSNRVGTFDEAFKSRIQVALHYENLSRVSRKKVWRNMLDMLEEDGEDAKFEEIRQHLDELAEHELNGRVIRNALTTARQLALYKKQRLAWDHVDQAVNVSLEFDKYLTDVRGHTDEQYIRDINAR